MGELLEGVGVRPYSRGCFKDRTGRGGASYEMTAEAGTSYSSNLKLTFLTRKLAQFNPMNPVFHICETGDTCSVTWYPDEILLSVVLKAWCPSLCLTPLESLTRVCVIDLRAADGCSLSCRKG